VRTPMMAGNWKMNKTPDEAVGLAQEIHSLVGRIEGVECVVCPPFVSLPAVAIVLQGTPISVGAQNLHWEESGAYTGEVSASMLVGLASHVIIGHSERRQYFHETDESVNKKIKAALKHGLVPIVCVGESLEQNEAGETSAFVGGQVRAALDGLDAEAIEALVIAYEPIWAIGTGRAATAEQAGEICGDVVRSTVRDLYGDAVADNTRILYGGSTNAKNIREIMEQPEIDGALIGGASISAESYGDMVRFTSEVYQK
jgi:triosephosphate isomerase (TIM)